MVIDIETRVDPLTLSASGRTKAPRDMPAALQIVVALAILHFERDGDGRFKNFELTGLHGPGEGEKAIVSAAERDLARLHASGGELVTFNGAHDLGIIRFALLRHRMMGGVGALRWLDDPCDRHHDTILETSRGGRRSRLADISAALGFGHAAHAKARAPIEAEREKAEMDVVMTMLLHIHLEAERIGDVALLRSGALALGRFIAANVRRHPHLATMLQTPLYASANRDLAVGVR